MANKGTRYKYRNPTNHRTNSKGQKEHYYPIPFDWDLNSGRVSVGRGIVLIEIVDKDLDKGVWILQNQRIRLIYTPNKGKKKS